MRMTDANNFAKRAITASKADDTAGRRAQFCPPGARQIYAVMKSRNPGFFVGTHTIGAGDVIIAQRAILTAAGSKPLSSYRGAETIWRPVRQQVPQQEASYLACYPGEYQNVQLFFLPASPVTDNLQIVGAAEHGYQDRGLRQGYPDQQIPDPFFPLLDEVLAQ